MALVCFSIIAFGIVMGAVVGAIVDLREGRRRLMEQPRDQFMLEAEREVEELLNPALKRPPLSERDKRLMEGIKNASSSCEPGAVIRYRSSN
jgi:hypothetical protein